jgi:hypothetical protein
MRTEERNVCQRKVARMIRRKVGPRKEDTQGRAMTGGPRRRRLTGQRGLREGKTERREAKLQRVREERIREGRRHVGRSIEKWKG